MTLPAVLEQSPRLALYLGEIQAKLAGEKEARQRFRRDMPESAKAEFINGEVVMNPPVRIEHARTGELLFRLLSTYVDQNGVGFVGFEKLLVCLTRNDYEPDIAFWNKGKSQAFTPRQLQFPAPDFIVEVLSESTEKTDRGVKMDDYAAHGVLEYWLVDPEMKTVEQYLLHGDVYQLALKSGSGDVESAAVPGFRIPVVALFDDQTNLAVLKTLLL